MQSAFEALNDKMIQILAPLVEPLGYEVIHVETQLGREGTLRVFIDHLDPARGAIGIEDCAEVSRNLDTALESDPLATAAVAEVFKGTYELEVSSPGVERPLRRPKDFARFSGRNVKITVTRPLTADEIANAAFAKKFPKHKVFQGVLCGTYAEGAQLEIGMGKPVLKKGQKPGKRAKEEAAKVEKIQIPFAIISRAVLEPEFDFESE